jgi:hypothetical protein
MVYIWFLLVFSYMMLFHMIEEENALHWTKIYLIITVSAMLIEDVLKVSQTFTIILLFNYFTDYYMTI